uniref:Uncharacterized protein n=1 Tax=Ditylenchus dipsaci TaxID=166011 RepID=A0A915DD62_9BILA
MLFKSSQPPREASCSPVKFGGSKEPVQPVASCDGYASFKMKIKICRNFLILSMMLVFVEVFVKSQQCGMAYQKPRITAKITKEAIPHSWPWMAVVCNTNLGVTSDESANSEMPSKKERCVHNRYTDDEPGMTVAHVKKIHVYPKYFPDFNYDVALLELTEPIELPTM